MTPELLSRIKSAGKNLAHRSRWGNAFAQYYMNDKELANSKKELIKVWDKWNKLMVELEEYVKEFNLVDS